MISDIKNTLLWTNPNPDNEMATDTDISLDLQSYRFVFFRFKESLTLSYSYCSPLIKIESSSSFSIQPWEGSLFCVYIRGFAVYINHVIFYPGYSSNGSSFQITKNGSVLIPLEIWGVK